MHTILIINHKSSQIYFKYILFWFYHIVSYLTSQTYLCKENTKSKENISRINYKRHSNNKKWQIRLLILKKIFLKKEKTKTLKNKLSKEAPAKFEKEPWLFPTWS